jgi:hypothetical protein
MPIRNNPLTKHTKISKDFFWFRIRINDLHELILLFEIVLMLQLRPMLEILLLI